MYSRETEIRHISSTDIFKLGQILEQTNSWKKLMRIIPKSLSTDQIDTKKYNNDHIRLIENASVKQNRTSTEILFEEWGTSGRKRPTVENLLDLLIKAELFRAADFVAINYLSEPPPERPSKGPAAKIDISLPLLTEDIREVEKILDDIPYPGTKTLLENSLPISEINNRDFYKKVTLNGKNIVEATTATKTIISNTTNANTRKFLETDLIKFSSDNIVENATCENNIPNLSELVGNIDSTQLLEYCSMSAGQQIQNGLFNKNDTDVDKLSSKDSNNCDNHLPDLSVLNGEGNENDDGCHANVDDGENSDPHSDSLLNDSSASSISQQTPNLSILDQSGGSGLNDSSLTNVTETSDDSSFSCDGTKLENSDNSNIPCISALNN